MVDKPTVEGVTSNRNTVRPKNILVTLPARTGLGTKLNQAKITRPTAEVGNQYEFVMIKLLFVLICRGDRLQLELDL